MIARWWRSSRFLEEWQLLVLRPDGGWSPLALVKSRREDQTPGWYAAACITPGGKGSVWMGSEVQTLHRRRARAFRAAEALCGFQRPVLHATWPADYVREWDYAPSPRRAHQRARAVRGEILTAFLDGFFKVVAAVVAVRRQAVLKETKKMMDRVIRDLAIGHLAFAAGRLENATYDEVGLEAVTALMAASEALEKYKKAREELHQPSRRR